MDLADNSSKNDSVEGNMKPRFPQSIDHVHKNYGRYLEADIMAYDASYALHELFEFSAASIDQFLEVFKDKLRTRSHISKGGSMSEPLIAKNLIDDYRLYVKHALDIDLSNAKRQTNTFDATEFLFTS